MYRRPGVDFGEFRWLEHHFRAVLRGLRHVAVTSDNRRRLTLFDNKPSCVELPNIDDAYAKWEETLPSVGESYFGGASFPQGCEGVGNTGDIVIGTQCNW